jgi:hypothetical protein
VGMGPQRSICSALLTVTEVITTPMSVGFLGMFLATKEEARQLIK